VIIQLFKGIAMVRDVATGAPNGGAYDWPIPVSLLVGFNYKIKITTLDNVVTAVSPAFVIN